MLVKRLGRVDYESTFEAMRAFTAARIPETLDELWLCEHPPVFTQGIAGKDENVLDAGAIELRQSSGSKYLGVTITVNATSREQLDELYRTLSTHPMVKVVL